MDDSAAKTPVPPATIVSKRAHVVPGRLLITEYFFQVPLDYNDPDGKPIFIFAKAARKFERPVDPTEDSPQSKQLPYLAYLQGGPGFPCGAPESHPITTFAVDKGYETLWIDTRGNGLSTKIAASTLDGQFGGDAPAMVQYMKHFRADNIVRDFEAIRLALTADFPERKRKWSVIGQSFGGFCAVTYLSLYPEGLQEAFLTGGLPPASQSTPDEVYRRLFRGVVNRNRKYYEKYPEDILRVKEITNYLVSDSRPTASPSGVRLTPRRFLQLGLSFGFHGGLDRVHDIVTHAYFDLQQFGHITRATLATIEASGGFDNNVIYCLLHEPLYCQRGQASDWSANRVMKEFPEFNLDVSGDAQHPLFFTGEMVFPHMLLDFEELRKLQEVGNMLATEKWGDLYDARQLSENEVPTYAAVYVDDLYVDYNFSQETAAMIKGCKMMITNQIYHEGVRTKPNEVLNGLWKLRTDTID